MTVERMEDLPDLEYGDAAPIEASPDRRMEGIFALWHAVLLRAIADWTIYRDRVDPRSRMIWKGAAQWLFGPDDQFFNSFDSICRFLGWNPKKVRCRIKDITAEDIDRIRSRRR